MPATKRKTAPFTTRSGWSPARRLAQAQRLRVTRPWLRSTGPKTASGKAKSSRNATRHGGRSASMRLLCRALRAQRQFQQVIRANVRAHRAWRLSGYQPEFKPFDVSYILFDLHSRFCSDGADAMEGMWADNA